MASPQSYSDFERVYNTHLSKVRAFLAAPANNQNPPAYASDVSSCEQALHDAKQCITAMRGLAEIEGDPFKAEETKRKLERDVGPLEEEMRARKKAANGGGGRMSSVFHRSNAARAGGGGRSGTTSDERYLFGNNDGAYAAPSVMSGLSDDFETGEGSLTAPLTIFEQRARDSERMLRETQALCAESEQVGTATLETMGRQREQIERSSGLIGQSMENVQQAKQIMQYMAHRALKNKIVLYCIIGLLVFANGGVLVHLWRRKK